MQDRNSRGIGPEATSEFYRKLIREVQRNDRINSNRDFPNIFINSIPAPELVNTNVSDEELEPYIEGLLNLDRFELDFIVIVCNTIHLFYDTLQKSIDTPILDLRSVMEHELNESGIKSVLVIGTPLTINANLYKFKGIRCFKPNRSEIDKIVKAIVNFNNGKLTNEDIMQLRKICLRYRRKGAESVILGCTELAVMLGDESFPKINTIDVLVKATIKKMDKISH